MGTNHGGVNFGRRSPPIGGQFSTLNNSYRLSGNGDLIDWSAKSGAYAYLRVAEEHERLMRGD